MKTAKQMLEEIVEFLNTPGEGERAGHESTKLWAVLSALRGPDNDTYVESDNYLGHVKVKSTASLRGAIGLIDNISFITNNRPLVPIPIDDFRENGGYHFASHFNLALKNLEEMGFKVEKKLGE